jgi:molecular chaperone GrpE
MNDVFDNKNERQKEELVERFRAYLDGDFALESTTDGIDQMSLFRELTGLRNEVRIESRQFKGALDDFRQAFTSLDGSQQDIAKMMQAKEQQEREVARTILAPAVSGLIELYDRIAAGLQVQPPSPSLAQRILPGGRRGRQWLEGHMEGQKIILGRILDLLEQCGVFAIKAEGERFDPNFMKAVGFELEPQQPNNTVLQENLKGFRQDQKIVRAPEVVVNKREE